MIKTIAFRLGLQSLYEDPEQILKKYKDFDIVKAMGERKGVKLLWVRARAIDADVVNTNGDYFSKEELLKEVEVKGEKIPAYKTFEGVPIFSNHKNDNIDDARGMVVYAEWNEDENSVYCTFFVDEEAYPDVARSIRTGYIHDVSMGTSVTIGECSICKNEATTESAWCSHLKKHKGRKDPQTGKLVYEINKGLKFIELSVVNDGAFDTCEIKALMEPDEVLAHVDKLDEKVASIQANITLAAIETPEQPLERIAYENCLRQISSTTKSAVKIAQQAGNLVGGPLMSLDNASQNATVNNIINYLGLDPHNGGLNVLDLMNLALNFLEVAVMNLFSRKDNIDLAHVGKITKAMADLQSTMQDLIDDGMGNNQAKIPTDAPAPQGLPTDAGVGQVIAPQAPANNNATPVQQQFLTDDNPLSEEEGNIKLSKTTNLLTKLAELLNLLSFNKDIDNDNDNNIEYGGNNLMSFAGNFTQNYNKEENIYEIESDNGYKVVLSASGKASGFIDNKKTSYDPIVTVEETSLIEKGDLKTAAERILHRHMKIAAKIYETPSIAQLIDEENTDSTKIVVKPMETQLKEDHIYDKNNNGAMKTLQERTESRRHEVKGPIENRLGEEGWNSRKGTMTRTYEEMLDKIILPRGTYEEVYEDLLQDKRLFVSKNAVDNVEKIIVALATAAINTGMTPDEMIDGAQNIADDGPDLITKAKMAKDDGNEVPGADDDPTMAAADSLSDQVDSSTSPGDLHQALVNALQELSVANKAITNAVKALAEDNVVTPKIDDATPTDSDLVGADLATKADDSQPDVSDTDVKSGVSSIANTADDLGVGTDDVLDATSGINENNLQSQIELNKTPTLTATRKKNMQRIAFYGFNRKASKKDILKVLIGHLADYSKDYNLRSKDLARVICSFNDAPNVSRKLAAQALAEKRNASIHVKEEKHETKEFCLNVSDLGVSANDPNIDDILKEKITTLLQSNGYDLGKDFALTSIDYFPDGRVIAKVESRISKTYEANSAAVTAEPVIDNSTPDTSDLGTMTPDALPGADSSMLNPNSIQPAMNENNPRAAKRAKLMEKFAQFTPGIVPGNPAASGGPPAPAGGVQVGPPGGPGAAPEGPNPADGSLSPADSPTPPPSPGMGDDMGSDTPSGDNAYSPGVIKPLGAVCPLCQSMNLDLAGGQGKCNDCGTAITVEMLVKITPPDKHSKHKGSLDPKDAGMGMDQIGGADEMSGPPGEIGLGAATAPESTPPLPQAPGGGLPSTGTETGSPVAASSENRMFRISYTMDPDVFVDGNIRTARKLYPAGMICPLCTTSDVTKNGSQSICNRCNKMFITDITENEMDPRLLDVKIKFII